MNYAVCYSSATGNTRKIAEAIYAALPDKKMLCDLANSGNIPACDLLFVGFWIDKGACDEHAREFLSTLQNQRLALFGTMGAAGGGAYAEGLLAKVAALMPRDCENLGGFLCQGHLDAATKDRYEEMARTHPENPHIKAQLVNFETALTHPDAADLAEAAAFARKIVTL